MEDTSNDAVESSTSNNEITFAAIRRWERQRQLRRLEATTIMKRRRRASPISSNMMTKISKQRNMKHILEQHFFLKHPLNDELRFFHDNLSMPLLIEGLEQHVLQLPNMSNYNSSLPLEEDPTRELPKSVVIMYCEGCQSYSYTGRSVWHKFDPNSLTLLRFLLRRVSFHIRKLQLWLISAHFMEHDNGFDSTVRVALNLQYEAADGSRHTKISTVRYNLGYLKCPSCSDLIDETQLSSVLQLRLYSCSNQILDLLHLRVLQKRPTFFNIKKIKHTDNGMDFFFDSEHGARKLNYFLKVEAPVKTDPIIENIVSTDTMIDNTAICQSCIRVTVCPISRDDLVYLPKKVFAALGIEYMGPLVICTKVSRNITFIDPLKLNECWINSNNYWRDPFEPLKVSQELVEYIVLDIEIVLSGPLNSLGKARVARVSDFGKNDTSFMVETHLGNTLKAGDYALGYDLVGAVVMNCEDMLPDVVLIKKKYVAKLRHSVPQKNASPDYEKFLVDLEKNPAAMFNLSLEDGDDAQKHDLDDLLARLDLTD
ncbi:hypothetical protein SOVF_069850 [Spinacia oleracea]|nr:hypothetical protein SOVF_069850 [Spinacia oleracea]